MSNPIFSKEFTDDDYRGKEYWRDYISHQLPKTIRAKADSSSLVFEKQGYSTIRIVHSSVEPILLRIDSTGLGYSANFLSESEVTANQRELSEGVFQGLRKILSEVGANFFGDEPKRGDITIMKF